MRVLVIGSGGREHALCWALAASPLCDRLFCAPGNAGIAQEAECVPIAADDLDRLVTFGRHEAIDYAVIGPEQPLVLGLVDRFAEAHIKAFGPSRSAAMLEGSKGFMKDLCARYSIPTAAYGRFTDVREAKTFIARAGLPAVIKADGLAAGKGVTIAANRSEAEGAIEAMLVRREFDDAGAEIVIEEFLDGEEASFFALVDGSTALPFASAQDHKRVGDGDTGPNTGGMGAYSPTPALDDDMAAQVMDRIINPTVWAMREEGRPYKGVLYAGLMITEFGPKLLEYNVRFGDPECQVLLPRLKSDLLPALIACTEGMLGTFDLRWLDVTALVVVLAARGYPGTYKKGDPIGRLDELASSEDVLVFHAGTAHGPDGEWIANGGRVLGITGLGATVAEARARAYQAVDRINWPGGFCRRDIGWRASPPNT